MRNWSKIALEWNLANDAEIPTQHTPGGCVLNVKGAITINSLLNSYTKNVAYYIICSTLLNLYLKNSQRIGSTLQI